MMEKAEIKYARRFWLSLLELPLSSFLCRPAGMDRAGPRERNGQARLNGRAGRNPNAEPDSGDGYSALRLPICSTMTNHGDSR